MDPVNCFRPRSNSLSNIEDITYAFSLNLHLDHPIIRPRSLSAQPDTGVRPELGYSPLSTERLIAALESPNSPKLFQRLAASADELPPLELAVLIASILQGSFIADNIETSCFTCSPACSKVCVNAGLPQDQLESSSRHFAKRSNPTRIVKFLKTDYPSKDVEIDDDFINETWCHLAKAFNSPKPLHELGLRKVLLATTIKPWINEPCPSVAGVRSLAFMSYMCSSQPLDTCNMAVWQL